MTPEKFEIIVAEEFERIPEKWRARLSNIAILAEDEPSEEVRKLQGLGPEETLLGLYQGIPHIERGEGYGIGISMPDTITIYRLPTIEEAGSEDEAAVRKVVADTLWHEIAHHLGFDESMVAHRENDGTNSYRA